MREVISDQLYVQKKSI